jgi:hypothetical protein
LVVDEFVGFQDLGEEVPAWSRPNFFALRYELADSRGVLARIGVHGIGGDRHVLAETAEGSWKFGIFPLNQPEVPIWPSSEDEPIAHYQRGPTVQVRFVDGPEFQIRKEGTLKTFLEDLNAQPVLTVEQVEAFPRWRAEMKLEPDALQLPQLPLLVACVGCVLVFE